MVPWHVARDVHCASRPQSEPALPGGCAHRPAPSHTSWVHGFPSSEHGVPTGVKHVFPLQTFAHSGPDEQGSMLLGVQTPFTAESGPLQNMPSSQGDPLGSGPVQLPAFSSHDSLALESPSGPGQFMAFVWIEHIPTASHQSSPVQMRPSLHALIPAGCSAVQLAEQQQRSASRP